MEPQKEGSTVEKEALLVVGSTPYVGTFRCLAISGRLKPELSCLYKPCFDFLSRLILHN